MERVDQVTLAVLDKVTLLLLDVVHNPKCTEPGENEVSGVPNLRVAGDPSECKLVEAILVLANDRVDGEEHGSGHEPGMGQP
jgi:hypothetical protein